MGHVNANGQDGDTVLIKDSIVGNTEMMDLLNFRGAKE